MFFTWGNVGVGVEGSRGSGRELLDSCGESFFTEVLNPGLTCEGCVFTPFLFCFLALFSIPAGAVAAEKWSAGAVAARK